MMSDTKQELDELVNAIRKSRKYRYISEDLIRNIGTQELTKRPRLKEAIKATKRRLHQVGGAYFETRIDYDRALAELDQAISSGDGESLQQVCRKLMGLHTSTVERLDILKQFYTQTLAPVPSPRIVLDIACGLNPLAIPWMPLDERVTYYAYDIYEDMVDFISKFMDLVEINGYAEVCDVVQSPPFLKADLALILKSIPCLEQIDEAAGIRLLDTVNADYLLISFPVHSLGGRDVGMAETYEAKFCELTRGREWSIQKFEFATELAFLVAK